MKLTIKILLVMCLFSSVALAEGEIGTGGKTCPPSTACLESDGEIGTGGRTANNQNQNDSVLTFIQKYLISIFE